MTVPAHESKEIRVPSTGPAAGSDSDDDSKVDNDLEAAAAAAAARPAGGNDGDQYQLGAPPHESDSQPPDPKRRRPSHQDLTRNSHSDRSQDFSADDAYRPLLHRFNVAFAVADVAVLFMWAAGLYFASADQSRVFGTVLAGSTPLRVDLRVLALFWLVPPAALSVAWCIPLLTRAGDRTPVRVCCKPQPDESIIYRFKYLATFWGENGSWHAFITRRNPALHATQALIDTALAVHWAAVNQRVELVSLVFMVNACIVSALCRFAAEPPKPRVPLNYDEEPVDARLVDGDQTRWIVLVLRGFAVGQFVMLGAWSASRDAARIVQAASALTFAFPMCIELVHAASTDANCVDFGPLYSAHHHWRTITMHRVLNCLERLSLMLVYLAYIINT